MMLAGWNPLWVGFSSDPLERMRFFNAVPQALIVSMGVAFMIIGGVSLCSKSSERKTPISYWIAEHAFALYLTHMLALRLVHRHVPSTGIGFWGLLFIVFLSSGVLAAIVRWCIERPALALRSRLLTGVNPAGEAVVRRNPTNPR